jgi:uncharacterized protein
MSIRERMRDDLTAALRGREMDRVSTLRSLLGEIANAEAVETDRDFVPMAGRTNDVPRRALTEADVRGILEREGERHREAMAEFENAGRQDAAERLQAGLKVIEEYLQLNLG